MKKLCTLLLVFLLMLSVSACGGESDSSKDEPKEEAKKEEVKDDKEEAKEDDKEDPKENKDADTEEASTTFDKTLKGKELLKAASSTFKLPESYRDKMRITYMGGVNISSTYVSGDSFYTEIVPEAEPNGPKAIIIYKADEGFYYNYVQGETTGIKGIYEEEMKDEMKAGTFFTADDKDLDEGGAFGLIDARVEMLDGEEMVYFERITEDGLIAKNWYSIKDRFLRKVIGEVDSGDVVAKYEVLEFEFGGDYRDKLILDENITFTLLE